MVAAAKPRLSIPLVPGIAREVFSKSLTDPFAQAFGVDVETPDRPEVFVPEVEREVRSGNPRYDVVEWSEPDYTFAKRLGLCEPLRVANIPNISDVLEPYVDNSGHGVGVFVWAMVMVYDPERVAARPSSWRALWEPAFSGQVSVRNMLTASYIMPVICKVLGMDTRELNSDAGLNHAWAKLEELSEQVKVWWESEAHMQQLMARRQVLVGEQYNDVAQVQKDRGVPVEPVFPLEGGIFGFRRWTVVKNSRSRDLAEAFINFALAEPQQRALIQNFYGVPINRRVQLDPAFSLRVCGKTSPVVDDFPDWEWYVRRPAELEDRWKGLLESWERRRGKR